MAERNLILIGMPGAGKSTVGVVLAKRLGRPFVDTDLLIQTRAGRLLQQILDTEGPAAFRRLEEEVLLELETEGAVIATGGSVVYGERGMAALRRGGTVVFLDLPLPLIEERVRDMDRRGLVMEPGETLADLYRRRLPLYRRHADLTIPCGGKRVEEICREVEAALEGLLRED